MKDTNEKQFLYNDIKERYKLVNKIYFIAMNIMYLMFAVYLVMRVGMGSISK